MTIQIRILEPCDCDAARKLFSDGMQTTITKGLRTSIGWRILTSFVGLLALLCILLFGTAAFAYAYTHAHAFAYVLVLGQPRRKFLEGAFAFALSFSIFLWWFVPRSVAQSYVEKALETDMKDPFSHYINHPMSTHTRTHTRTRRTRTHDNRSCFWVALEDGVVVGIVAVEPLQKNGTDMYTTRTGTLPQHTTTTTITNGSDPGGTSKEHESSPSLSPTTSSSTSDSGRDAAELRRMSVAASHRRRGVSKLLFHELHTFAVAKGFERIVLSTSSNQQAAVKLYPKYGFTCVHKTPWPFPWFPLMHIHFFAMDIGLSTCTRIANANVNVNVNVNNASANASATLKMKTKEQ